MVMSTWKCWQQNKVIHEVAIILSKNEVAIIKLAVH